jgi:outer membrane protein assembly factor BamB
MTRATSGGTFAEEITIPATAKPGAHTVSARGASSGKATAIFIMRTDWPMPRFVPEGTGFNPYENVLNPSNVGNLELAWSATTNGGLFSTPVVVGGVVYVNGQVDTSGTGQIRAFDASTGAALWKQTGSGLPRDLTVAEGRVYTSFTSHVLRCYDAATGTLLWSAPGPTHDPTLSGGVVYATDDLRSLWAIDAATGRKRWVAHSPLGGYGAGVAVADGMVYAGGTDVDGTAPLYAYDARTGELVWKHGTGGAIGGIPAVSDGTVYAGSGDHLLYAMEATTGRLRWTAATGGTIVSSAAVANGVAYIGSADHNLYAFDAATGEELWVAPTGGTITTIHMAAVANGVVYVGSSDHSEYAFDAATGEQLWSYETGSLAYKQSVVDGTLYFTSGDGQLYAFRLPAAQPQGYPRG